MKTGAPWPLWVGPEGGIRPLERAWKTVVNWGCSWEMGVVLEATFFGFEMVGTAMKASSMVRYIRVGEMEAMGAWNGYVRGTCSNVGSVRL